MKLDLFPEKRHLKIYYGHSRKKYTKHPIIRFGGKYLKAMGFETGERIEVDIHKDGIIIKKVKAKK